MEITQEIISTADQEKCIKQPVQNVKRNVKCHLSQHKESLFTVKNVSRNTEIDNYLSQIIRINPRHGTKMSLVNLIFILKIKSGRLG